MVWSPDRTTAPTVGLLGTVHRVAYSDEMAASLGQTARGSRGPVAMAFEQGRFLPVARSTVI